MNNLLNFYNLTSTELSSAVITLNIILAFFIVSAIVWVYRRTHRGLSYSQSFLVTMVMVSILAAVVMMVVRENLVGAFALLGAFSMIRFRTIVKDTKDVAFVFFSLVEGVAVGTSNYTIALITLVLISGVLLLLHRLRFGASIQAGYVLLIQTSKEADFGKLNLLLGSHAKAYEILHIKSLGDLNEHSFAINFKEGSTPQALVEGVINFPGVRSVDLLTGKESVEY